MNKLYLYKDCVLHLCSYFSGGKPKSKKRKQPEEDPEGDPEEDPEGDPEEDPEGDPEEESKLSLEVKMQQLRIRSF